MGRKFASIPIGCILIFSFLASAFAQQEPVKKSVLVLNSYNPDYWWTGSIVDGVKSTLKDEVKKGLGLHTWYMYSHRRIDEKHFDNFSRFYKHSMDKRSQRFDVVITSDNIALEFVLRYRKELFDRIPVVFCGVNNFSEEMLEGDGLVTGVVEQDTMEQTVEIALKLHPKARQVVLFREDRASPIMDERLRKLEKRFAERAKFITKRFVEPTEEEFVRELEKYGSESIILFMSTFAKTEDLLRFRNIRPIIQKRCKAPIYVLSERWFRYAPIMGGKFNSAFHQGKIAAEMALRILNGEDVRNIPLLSGVAARYIFDYRTLKHFGIPFSRLPKEETVIINEPESFYYVYKKGVWVTLGIGVFLVSVVVFLLFNVLHRHQTEKELLRYQSKLKSLATELSHAGECERRQIAKQLHDHIGQSLVVAKIKMQQLCESLPVQQNKMELGGICDSLDETIQNMRSLTFDLGTPLLYELGFEEALAEWIEEKINGKQGITVEFEADESIRLLDIDIQAMLFRNVKELLINALKHSKGRVIKVLSQKIDNRLCLSVEDDGIGFNEKDMALRANGSGYGLFSIREQLEQIGGAMWIHSEEAKGTRITLVAPIAVEQKVNI
jgi:signal transduction histidine kinase